MSVGTSNFSPAGNRNPFAPLCDNRLGVGSDMWLETGNLMFPWRPDYLNQNICADNPQAGLVLVDHVPVTWMAQPGGGMPDVLTDAHSGGTVAHLPAPDAKGVRVVFANIIILVDTLPETRR